ncbi:SNF2 family N-terminal domain-containing protein [Truncatella angustata]|uniref:SNF2 family N-terminal domain-containing protein n=1 Tax=Truncatella angustata TaxID=152316 RepID=A0A9P8RP02_9PEZI|nr:SNF2 family N-terminal domain-containing protein [Truncatella angustata]KAH6647523.1 SNF2 family N-terminal domain-containing protein [Truncatella angustata]
MVREHAPPSLPLRPSSHAGNAGASSSQLNQEGDKPRPFQSHNGFGPIASSSRPSSQTGRPHPAQSHHGAASTTSNNTSVPTQRPAVKASAYGTKTSMDDKYANLFIQPKSRPEHHRPTRINGPLGPSAKDRKPPAPPMFTTVGSSGNPISVADSSPRTTYTNPNFFSSQYVDPKKASADLKALIEGSLEDEEEDKVADDSHDRSQVEGLKVRLLPHQVEGVEWMRGRELGPVKKGKVPKGGILADDMGLGKTLQSISLILTNSRPKDSPKMQGVEKTTLVVAPLALIRQWEAELKEKVDDSHKLKVLVHHGPQRTKRFEDLKRYDVVITTYQILVSEHGHSNASVKAGCFGLHWYRVILDEAHTIKNRNAKSTKACYDLRTVYRWCLSGTPMQNNLEELQSLIKFLRISPYDDLKEWKEHIELPMKNGKGDVAIQHLHSVLRCFMKRRTKDILKKPGALDVGGKKSVGKDDEEKSATSDFKITERKVVSVQTVFSPAERRFYDRLEARTDRTLETMMKTKGKVSYANALVLLLRLRQVCNHPKLVEGKLEKDKEALSTESKTKKGDADVDALADLLGGLGVEAKHCDICGWELDRDNRVQGKEICKSCFEDLEYFNNHENEGAEVPQKVKKPKAKVKKVIKEKVKTELVKKPVRKPRNRTAVLDSDDEEDNSIVRPARKPAKRNAILDSDDEEADGSWLVSGDEQGSLRLGKAGGTDDENAEGEGDSINTRDSDSDSEDDGSNLDSFIVHDEEDVKPEGLQRASTDAESDSEDEFESISVIKSQVEAEKARAALKSEEADNDSDSEEGISASEFESDSDADRSLNPFYSQTRKNKEKTPLVLASAKIRQLMTIVHKEVDEHKFIVFSQFTSMLDIVERFFKKDGIRYTRYDGGMKNDAREASLDSLRNDPRCRVLLCSLRCGALGLNLTAASRVVILEPFWNPFVEEQAIDRVHRLTQKVDVVVYKLTVENTVEERILELQEKKRLLAEQAIEGGMRKEGVNKLGVKEMMELFRHVGASARSGFVDDRTVAQDVGHYIRRKPREENSVYGRRW